MKTLKSDFALQLGHCLHAFYGGRLPSFAKIARDFSLRSPHLPHVTAETIRNWTRGTAIPHVSRMQVLVEWLGPEVASAFDHHARALLTGEPRENSNRLLAEPVQADQQCDEVDATTESLLSIFKRLNDQERQAVFEIAQLLVARHGGATQGNGHLPEVAPNTHDPVDLEPDA